MVEGGAGTEPWGGGAADPAVPVPFTSVVGAVAPRSADGTRAGGFGSVSGEAAPGGVGTVLGDVVGGGVVVAVAAPP